MILTMNDENVRTIEDVREVLETTGTRLRFRRQGRAESYRWMEETLVRLRYLQAGKRDRGTVRAYLVRMTGYSRAQVTRLIERYRRSGHIRERMYRRHQFPRRYTDQDLRFLAMTDSVHEYPNAASVKRVLRRMATVYGQPEYEGIAGVSVSHIYNLRKSVVYRRLTNRYVRTRPVQIGLGQRRKPQPNGMPGYLRVDTVHQGDQGGQKGVYHINTVDEVTQFECVAAVERISEHALTPMLAKILESYPFIIREFHADNGSEYINRVVVKLLNRLLIRLTKSRPRHVNDNALVETKNGWVLRKWMGYQFIGQKHAARINAFYFGCFNEYLNFHRPCAFPREHTDAKGRVIRRYPYQDYRTPYEKLKSLAGSTRYLKPGITFALLDTVAARRTDNDMARLVQQQRARLFEIIIAVRDPRLSLRALQAHS